MDSKEYLKKLAEENRATRKARREKIAALGTPPDCHNCGKPLAPYRNFDTDHAAERGLVWGYYGDGFFCSLRCGHEFGVAAVRAGYVRKAVLPAGEEV
jgi:hypothetical protein